MRKSFYTWLMAQRQGNPLLPLTELAELAFEDSLFPKHSNDFETISRYLEDEASFSFDMRAFDNIWDNYAEH